VGAGNVSLPRTGDARERPMQPLRLVLGGRAARAPPAQRGGLPDAGAPHPRRRHAPRLFAGGRARLGRRRRQRWVIEYLAIENELNQLQLPITFGNGC
jgi:hypothetical protein